MKYPYVSLLGPILLAGALFTSACGMFAASDQPPKPAPPDSSEVLYPISEDGKWGYIDRSGKVVVTPQFDAAERFHEGLAAVRLKHRLAFIDSSGAIAISTDFDVTGFNLSPFRFSEGLAPVPVAKKWGYIDKHGTLVIPAVFSDANAFSEGLARVESGGKIGYIDRTGNLTIAARFLSGEDFSEGVALVQTGEGKKGFDDSYGYIDKQGRFVIPPRRRLMPGSFSEGLAAFAVGGEVEYADNNVPVNIIGMEFGCIDKSGKTVIKPRFVGIGEFHDGLALAQTDGALHRGIEGSFGFIDTSGKLVIPDTFETAQPFSEGLAAVKQKGLWGFIDRTGTFVIPPRFNGPTESFSHGLAKFTHDHTSGYIDRTGKIVWKKDW